MLVILTYIYNINEKRATDFINLLEDHDFIQHVSGPTHNQGHTLHLVVSKGLNVEMSSIRDVALSDHYCIQFNVSCPCPRLMLNSAVKKRYLTPEVA